MIKTLKSTRLVIQSTENVMNDEDDHKNTKYHKQSDTCNNEDNIKILYNHNHNKGGK